MSRFERVFVLRKGQRNYMKRKYVSAVGCATVQQLSFDIAVLRQHAGTAYGCNTWQFAARVSLRNMELQ